MDEIMKMEGWKGCKPYKGMVRPIFQVLYNFVPKIVECRS